MRSRSMSFGFALAAASVLASAYAFVPAGPYVAQPVAGSGVHYFTSAIVHSQELTPVGQIQQSTETVDLAGDLRGRILYQPTSVFDFANGTLVNTGRQVFSGTIKGSAPVLLYDDEFRFDVNLATGATTGEVFLTDHIAGPKARCELKAVGTGMTREGNATFDYTGVCMIKQAVDPPAGWASAR